MSKKQKLEFPINSLVRIKEDCPKEYRYMTNEGDMWIYLGDIAQMPGHGIFLLHATFLTETDKARHAAVLYEHKKSKAAFLNDPKVTVTPPPLTPEFGHCRHKFLTGVHTDNFRLLTEEEL